MGATGVRYACAACGRESVRWEGRCPGCGEWNSMVEARDPPNAPGRRSGRARAAGPAPRPLSEAGGDVPVRRRLGLGDLDLVLGGGLVPGSLVLLGGAPGIGKSTLLLQVAGRLAGEGGRVLYVSGEESGEQVRLRGRRLEAAESVLFLAETDVGAVVAAAGEAAPELLCIDSIQTLHTEALSSAPGTVNQVRECASALQAFAKRTGTPTVLVGHVTKGGALAGPRALEHAVDVVLRMEGPRSGEHRLLRASKNRFGRVGDVAVFRMTGRGLDPVADPAAAFLADRPRGVSGSAVAVPLEGTRPLLAEVQALTAESRHGPPRRMTTGFPDRRLALLLAVLERRGGLTLAGSDVFVNVVGGLRLSDPASDLAVLAALVSAGVDRAVPDGAAFVGEVGLGGEVRGAPALGPRLREVERAGLTRAVVAAGTAAGPGGVRVRGVENVAELVRLVRRGAGDR